MKMLKNLHLTYLKLQQLTHQHPLFLSAGFFQLCLLFVLSQRCLMFAGFICSIDPLTALRSTTCYNMYMCHWPLYQHYFDLKKEEHTLEISDCFGFTTSACIAVKVCFKIDISFYSCLRLHHGIYVYFSKNLAVRSKFCRNLRSQGIMQEKYVSKVSCKHFGWWIFKGLKLKQPTCGCNLCLQFCTHQLSRGGELDCFYLLTTSFVPTIRLL